jgi:hypothetical protein
MADGILAKLTLLPFEYPETIQKGPPVGPPFIAQFNPETFTVANEFELGPKDPAHGDVGGEAKFKYVKPRTFSFEFLLDGTGASGETIDVLASIALFCATVGFDGKMHRPRFLVLSWGVFVYTCVLESFSINFKLFRPNGTPLRAVLSASFREHTDETLKELQKNLASPDLMHAHQVKDGDQLWLVVQHAYNDARYYLQVAEKNRLDNLRHLSPGSTLYLPPIV